DLTWSAMRPTPRKSSVSKRRRPSSRLRRSRAWTFSQTGAKSRSEKCTVRAPRRTDRSDRLYPRAAATVKERGSAARSAQAERPPEAGGERRRRSSRWILRSWYLMVQATVAAARARARTTPRRSEKCTVRAPRRTDRSDRLYPRAAATVKERGSAARSAQAERPPEAGGERRRRSSRWILRSWYLMVQATVAAARARARTTPR